MKITTERLVLIPVSEEHTKFIFEHFNEKVTTYMYPCPAKEIEETRKVVHNFMKQYEKQTDYVYAITLQSNGEFIGVVGLHHIKKDVPELGIWTKLASHGNHYGREAVGGVIQYAKSLGITKLSYPVDRRNSSSRKIPIFYGGTLVVEYKEETTPDGRILEEEIYEIQI